MLGVSLINFGMEDIYKKKKKKKKKNQFRKCANCILVHFHISQVFF